MSMLPPAKLEGDLEIKSEVEKFHKVLSGSPRHMANISPGKIQGFGLHAGEFGQSGTVAVNYHHDGKAMVAKDVIEVDDETKTNTFKVIEGDLLDEYKHFKIMAQVTPKEGGGSVLHVTLEYEKLNESIPDPSSFLEFLFHLAKNIDDHLQES